MPSGLGFVTLGDIPLPRLLELVKLADRESLHSVWLADEPFFRGALPSAMACAMVTSQLRIGLGVVNPYDHPPVWLAKDFATLQEIAGTRAVLGIGASWAPPIEAQGIPWTQPLAAVADAVAIVRELLAGRECTYQGKKFAAHGVTLNFETSLAGTPVHVGSMFPRSLEQAGAIADGVILSVLCPASYVQRARALIAGGGARAGRALDDFEVVQYIPIQIGDDGVAARNSIKRLLGFLIRHSYGSDPGHWVKVAKLGDFDLEEFASILARLEAGEPAVDAVSESFVDRFAIAGTPAACLDTLSAYKAAGTTEVVALFPSWCDLEQQIVTIGRRLVPEWDGL